MSFRDDLDAARERVASLEREVAAARARQKENRARIIELKTASEARPVPPAPRHRYRLGVPGWSFLVVLALLVGSIFYSAVNDARRAKWESLEPYQTLKKQLGLEASISYFEADRVDRVGKIVLREGAHLRVTTECEQLVWSMESEVEVSRRDAPCFEQPTRPIQCSPAAVWQRVVDRGLRYGPFVYMRYDGFLWLVRDPDSLPETVVVDDCPAQFWPPHG